MLKIKATLPTSQNMNQIELAYSELKERKDIGFLNLPFNKIALTDSVNLAQQLKKFKHLVLIGIGGSSMGPRALHEISGSKKLSFLDNVDAVETERVIQNIENLAETAWLMISKSGTTIEVLWTLELIEHVYKTADIPFWPNTFYITENTNNPLKNLSTTHHRPCLEIPLDVGGRFSVLSPVGLVIAEYLNLSATDILAGAEQALLAKKEVLLATEQYLASFERNEDITMFWFYCSNMRWFGCWLQQLWAESLGKKWTIDHKPAPAFSAPMIAIGTCDQHSILQQVIEGPKNKFVNFFRFNDVEKSKFTIRNTNYTETKTLAGLNYGELIKAEAIATEQALQDSGISTLSFELSSLNSKNIGFLFMFYQIIVATLGQYAKINAFDQPSVAISKKLTLQYLATVSQK